MMNKLFIYICSFIYIFINPLLSNSVSLKHEDKQQTIDSFKPNSDVDIHLTYHGSQPLLVSAPEQCSGSFSIDTVVDFSTASFILDCNSRFCRMQRTFTGQALQSIKAGFPYANGYEELYSGSVPNSEVVQSPPCNGTTYQPQEITFSLERLVYSYSVNVINSTHFNVTRTFKEVKNANLTINGEIVASISSNDLLNPYETTKTCQAAGFCRFTERGDVVNQPYVGNDMLKFYYTIPTFVFAFSSIPNSIVGVCKNEYLFFGADNLICNNQKAPIGPCIAYEITSIVESHGDIIPTQFCKVEEIKKNICSTFSREECKNKFGKCRWNKRSRSCEFVPIPI